MSEYIELLKKVGFVNFESFIIDFWLHRLLFERKIGKMFIDYYMRKTGEKDKNLVMINLNSNLVYKFLSNLLSCLSFPRIFKNKDRWGYCFIVAKK